MSIGLLITAQDPDLEDQLISVASEAVYIRHWKTAALQLKLRWIPRLQTGWVVAAADVPPLLHELDILRRHLIDTQPEAEITHHVLARISLLSRELTSVAHRQDCRAFLGPIGLPFLRWTSTSPLKILWTKPVPTVLPDATR